FQLVAPSQLLVVDKVMSARGTLVLRSPVSSGNVWRRNGVVIGSGQEVEASLPGWYELTVQAGQCQFAASVYVSENGKVEGGESVDRGSSGKLGWRVYPNPSKGRYVLEGSQSEEGVLEVQVIDLQGRVLVEQRLKGRRFVEEIELGHVSTGVYLLQVRQWDGSVWVEKLVKE
ncbi:MAG: T9SS type A sorting domain-containing protein, partial [Cytophagales bacterium]|nr:T9SS type A sorting domain-containing protein [Cytophagales bacterium]